MSVVHILGKPKYLINLIFMYTAKVIAKEERNNVLILTVEFTNGVNTFSEQVTPQDKFGLDHWVTTRLRSLNAVEEMKDLDPATAPTYSVPVVPEKTAAELEADAWLKKYYRCVQVKQNLIDTDVLTGTEPKVVELLSEVKTGFKPAYLNLL